MAENSLGESYLPWLRTYCAERKTRSLNGLFYRLFFAENVAAIFRAQDGPPPSAPPVTAVCPVCGTAHEKRLDKCPACGIARDASRTDTANLKQVYALAPERRDGYLARENKILSSGGVFGDFQKKKARLDALRKEFGLKWEDGGP
jgi:hypothetical protein